MFYALLLVLHSWLRWAVLAGASMALVRASLALRQSRNFGPSDAQWARVWVGATDLQLGLGLLLYFAASPLAERARADLSVALHEPTLRFFGWLHPVLMFLAFVATHVTWALVRRTEDPTRRFARLRSGALCTLLLLLLAVPWPFWSFGRPLIRP